MRRIDDIVQNQQYIQCCLLNEKAEVNREFCRHGIDHALAVARISYILALEKNIMIQKDVIYAAALLHDIGRALQYSQKLSHHEEGARIAGEILEQCGYTQEEIGMIAEAIQAHKIEEMSTSNPLKSILYRADKLSRECYLCKVTDKCYWSEDMKNKNITY